MIPQGPHRLVLILSLLGRQPTINVSQKPSSTFFQARSYLPTLCWYQFIPLCKQQNCRA